MAGSQITLPNGLTLHAIGAMGTRSGGCYDRIEGAVQKLDPAGTLLGQEKLFYILDPPQRYRTKKDCDDGPPFLGRVESMFPQLLPLDDGTFLAIDGWHGVIVRFNAEFNSRSALLNRRVFVVDQTTFDEWIGKEPARAESNLQIEQDYLYRLLMRSKRRAKP